MFKIDVKHFVSFISVGSMNSNPIFPAQSVVHKPEEGHVLGGCVRNADFQAPLQLYWIRMCILTKTPGDLYAQ